MNAYVVLDRFVLAGLGFAPIHSIEKLTLEARGANDLHLALGLR